MPQETLSPPLTQKDTTFETPLRPQTLGEFIGQERTRERLEVMIGAAKMRGDVLDHCLFSGPPGLGKTTLASLLARAMGTQLVSTSGPMIDKPGDLAGILTNLQVGDILFIDEIHRLNHAVEEYLYSAMEDFVLDLMIDSGPNARSVQLKLNRFTLAGATTRVGLLTAPLRSRFPCLCRLDYYTPDILVQIVKRSANLLGVQIDNPSASELAKRARGTPRIVNNLLRWVRDFSQMRFQGQLNHEIMKKALETLEIDELGLDAMDQKILFLLIHHYEGGPVGLNTLATALGENPQTLEEVYEPYLILQGLIKRTPRGREITALGLEHLNRSRRENSVGV